MQTLPAETITAIINTAGAIMLAVLAFHLGRRKRNSEIESENAGTADKITEAAGRAVKLLSDRLDAEIAQRTRERDEMRRQIEQLQAESETWQKAYHELKSRFDALQLDYERLKKDAKGMLSS
jgi:uncharacterized coiled-coil DUF342 family protein